MDALKEKIFRELFIKGLKEKQKWDFENYSAFCAQLSEAEKQIWDATISSLCSAGIFQANIVGASSEYVITAQGYDAMVSSEIYFQKKLLVKEVVRNGLPVNSVISSTVLINAYNALLDIEKPLWNRCVKELCDEGILYSKIHEGGIQYFLSEGFIQPYEQYIASDVKKIESEITKYSEAYASTLWLCFADLYELQPYNTEAKILSMLSVAEQKADDISKSKDDVTKRQKSYLLHMVDNIKAIIPDILNEVINSTTEEADKIFKIFLLNLEHFFKQEINFLDKKYDSYEYTVCSHEVLALFYYFGDFLCEKYASEKSICDIYRIWWTHFYQDNSCNITTDILFDAYKKQFSQYHDFSMFTAEYEAELKEKINEQLREEMAAKTPNNDETPIQNDAKNAQPKKKGISFRFFVLVIMIILGIKLLKFIGLL